jgi:hypothetical protein
MLFYSVVKKGRKERKREEKTGKENIVTKI